MKIILKDLHSYARKNKIKVLQRFFKTGAGEYGEGDQFIGVQVPHIRIVAKKYQDSSYKNIGILLKSPIHEERLLGVFILVLKFPKEEERVTQFYLKNKKGVNNWDLIDLSADKILGAYLFKKNKSLLLELVQSKNLWDRRMSIVATYYFIKNNKFTWTLKLASKLLDDEEDLLHKATGWMLREVGKRDQKILEEFLNKNIRKMPRTMLRYAIERFPEGKRKAFLKK